MSQSKPTRKMVYLDRDNPLLGDRVQHISGRLGRVTEVRPWNRTIGFGELAIKWDDGIAASQYAFANQFSLVCRASGRLMRIPRNALAEMLTNRLQRSDARGHGQRRTIHDITGRQRDSAKRIEPTR